MLPKPVNSIKSSYTYSELFMAIKRVLALAVLVTGCASTYASPNTLEGSSWADQAQSGEPLAPFADDSSAANFGAGGSNTMGGFGDGAFISPSYRVTDPSPRITAVPEPTTYALMLLGLAGVVGLARHRARKAS